MAGKTFSIPLFYKDTGDNNAIKLYTGQTVTLRVSPYTDDLYTLTETVPGSSGIYKNDNVEDKLVRLYIGGVWKEDYGTFWTFGDLANILAAYMPKSGGTFTGEVDCSGTELFVATPTDDGHAAQKQWCEETFQPLSSGSDIPGNVLYVSEAYATEIAGKRYKTIQAAINYAATQSPSATNIWKVLIYENKNRTTGYSENITLQNYVWLIGIGMVRAKGTLSGMTANTRVENIFFNFDINQTIENIIASNCVFRCYLNEVGGLVLTLSAGFFDNCRYVNTSGGGTVVSAGNNTFINCMCFPDFEKGSNDKGTIDSLGDSTIEWSY
jgi:hypothetical protein